MADERLWHENEDTAPPAGWRDEVQPEESAGAPTVRGLAGNPLFVGYAAMITDSARSKDARERAWALEAAVHMLADIWAATDDGWLHQAAAELQTVNLLDDFDGWGRPRRKRKQYATREPYHKRRAAAWAHATPGHGA